MTPADDRDLEHGGDEILAAEYVLGVLPAQERQEAERRIETDPGFARLVADWQLRLSPLDEGYEEVVPPERLRTAIERRLFGPPDTAHAAARAGLWHSLAFWRMLAGTGMVAAIALAVFIALWPGPVEQPVRERLVASLASEESDVRFVALFDEDSGEIGLSHLAGEAGAERDFELWIIEGDNPPVSLGLVEEGDSTHLAAGGEGGAMLSSGNVLAISLEPDGGSPTGQPTGPVVASGDLHSM